MMCTCKKEFFTWRNLVVATMATLIAGSATVSWAVVITDGFGDADRDNANGITFYDTDVNNSGTWNSTTGDPNNPGPDENLNDKGLIEVTAAEDASDVGIVWLATRGFTSSNTGDPKGNIKIIDDNVATGIEPLSAIHSSGLALGYEGKGGGSSMIGAFGQPVVLGPDVGNMIRVKIDVRWWFEADNNNDGLPSTGEIRWGLFQDTDGEFGSLHTAGVIDPNGVQATVEWGAEDGDWRSNQPGAEGDKGIWSAIPNGPSEVAGDARIRFEYNVKNINGTSNNGRFLEGSGASNDPGVGGDVSTVASPGSNGPGGALTTAGTHELRMDFVRVSDGGGGSLVQVATFLDGVVLLRDEIKPTDSGAAFMQPAPESFDYIAFRNRSGKQDHVFDNFSIRNLVPEPTSMLLLSLGGLLALGRNRRR